MTADNDESRKLAAEVNSALREFDRLLSAPPPRSPRSAPSIADHSQLLHAAEARLRLAEKRKSAFDAKQARDKSPPK